MTLAGRLRDAEGLLKVAGCDNETRVCDLVFIHGLGGKSYSTWAADVDDRSTFWPEWIEEDHPEIGVWTLGYASDGSRWQSESMPLADRGTTVLEQFANRDLGGRPLIFITHKVTAVRQPSGSDLAPSSLALLPHKAGGLSI